MALTANNEVRPEVVPRHRREEGNRLHGKDRTSSCRGAPQTINSPDFAESHGMNNLGWANAWLADYMVKHASVNGRCKLSGTSRHLFTEDDEMFEQHSIVSLHSVLVVEHYLR